LKVREVCSQLVVDFVVEVPEGGVLNRAVHSFDSAVGQRIIGLGQTGLDAVGLGDHVEVHRLGIDCIAVPGLLGELNAVTGKNGVDVVRCNFE
jgi:hypothetical protein